MASVTIKQLLEAGVHFGHQTRRWNPAMEPYLYGERGGIHIIDLRKTADLIEEAFTFVRETVANGGTVLFVGTKKQVQAAVAEEATRAGMPYVNYRWLGGMLTNFQTIKKRIAYMKELERMDSSGEMEGLPKKERLRLRRELEKLQRNLGGVADLQRTPQAVFIVDTNIEHIALGEAKRLKIPVIALCDSNSDPSDVEFVVPGNDDAVRSAQLVASVIADACVAGRQKVDEAELAAKE
jgi:small subunit ribosomal protein S2